MLAQSRKFELIFISNVNHKPKISILETICTFNFLNHVPSIAFHVPTKIVTSEFPDINFWPENLLL